MNLKYQRYLIVLITFFFTISCKPKTSENTNFPSPEHYNFNKPDKKIVLDEDLDEISGIQFFPDEKNIAAIQDEQGLLFTVNLTSEEADLGKDFGTNGDFEDLINVDSTFYVLKSNGNIVKIIPDGNEYKNEIFKFKTEKDYEFEALYLNGDSLMLVSKKSPKKEKDEVSVIGFSVKTNQFAKSVSYKINAKTIPAVLKEKGKMLKEFRPSAAAIHPINKQLYILSSLENMLVITNLKGRVLNAYALDPKIFKQPEGIVFNKKGDLFISNEAKGFYANIFRFNYQP